MERIVLVGKPNCGKSLLFNQLTGLRQKVANFPGVTVELKTGQFNQFEVVDFPGTYSLHSLSKDEEIAVEKLNLAVDDHETKLVVCVLDAARLERSLVFALQVQALARRNNKAVVFVLNMIDEVERYGLQIDADALQAELGAPVYALSAKTLQGVSEFKNALPELVAQTTVPDALTIQLGEQTKFIERARQLNAAYGIRSDVVLKNQNRIDRFLLNNVLGGVAFLGIMFFLFQSIFTWAQPLMDGTEAAIGWIASTVTGWLGAGMAADFLNDAIFGGVGAFLVFVPQIMVLTLIIGILEDSGYLARAALICHKPLSLFGLSGRSFIPYLSGHACAIPAIMAARTIESPRKRLITMLTIPLMSCSARLPVYALLVAVLIPSDATFLGVFDLQGAAFFGLYFFGIVMALVVSTLMNLFTRKRHELNDMPFILELPSYRLPHWKPLLQRVLNSGVQFIKRAAPVIFIVSLCLWTLGYFPQGAGLEHSLLGKIGHFIEPIFEPLGLDWRYGVAIMMSFLAREVFVGALGTMFGMSGAEENIAGLAAQIQADGLSLGAGIGLLLFYVVALQCVATVAMLRAETGKSRIAWGLYVGYGVLAYCIAALAAHII
ncbi:ferrous iron transport protein B [Idiomarina fontislapidosi]|uniref:Ferrous iron transport protein B n=1 Tax=Idiomarina fontislapidosi TaxID=263723 RepID=A0A432Y8U8_9GAMM|nr:ferrous iron transporter B [Idiomarina fontislapidosi]PYE34638.1 ferrous iron transport protein B [Idiomarina fontislapidosi]RUO57410.1 ferrous iron transporter B [Idiomarina fontislapidosi]